MEGLGTRSIMEWHYAIKLEDEEFERKLICRNAPCSFVMICTPSSFQKLITMVNKVLSHEENCLFLRYFWTLNSNTFPGFLYHPQISLQVKGLESSVPGH